MKSPSKYAAALAAVFTFGLLAGCADQGDGMAATTSPELAGAWYQVYFDTNSVEINARGRDIVERVAYVTANNAATSVTVIGRTDRVGEPPANLALSHRRADAVRDALIGAGVPADRIETSWTGESKQAVATANQVDEPRNRVVDITVVKTTP
ncbi:OmpA family protein [Zavarzinia sp.]|uniref:OmpA family protein n=1 Tax=Zavarzinia sp. TaxID=2027920 RepID=UPI0035612D07